MKIELDKNLIFAIDILVNQLQLNEFGRDGYNERVFGAINYICRDFNETTRLEVEQYLSKKVKNMIEFDKTLSLEQG